MTIKAQFIGGDRLQSALRRLADRAQDATPAMASISATLLRQTERIFAQEGKGVGLDEPWKPLSEVTKHRRALAAAGGRQFGKNGKEIKGYSQATAAGGMKILQQSGKLAASVQPMSNAREAGLTTNRKYATTMFFGAKKGQFGRDGRNHPIPWGDIPARRFFPVRGPENDYRLTEPTEHAVIENLTDYLTP